MYLPRYEFKSNKNFLNYEFSSIGPKGAIKKIVRFTPINENIFNIGFGDLDEKTGRVNDRVVSNNTDSDLVLATIVAIIHDFSLRFPNGWIIAKGSTHSRTRLYRRGISRHLKEISIEFEIFGLRDDFWEPFEARKDYMALLVKRK